MVAITSRLVQSDRTGDGLQTKYYVNGVELVEGIDYYRTANGAIRISLRSNMRQGTAYVVNTAHVEAKDIKIEEKVKKPYYRKFNRKEKW